MCRKNRHHSEGEVAQSNAVRRLRSKIVCELFSSFKGLSRSSDAAEI